MNGSILCKMAMGIAAVGLVGTIAAGCGNRHGGHWGHHGHHFSDPEEAKEHAEKAAEWMLGKVDASAEQEEQVKAIVTAAVGDFTGLANQHRAQRAAFIAAFAQAIVDREELEKIRRSEMELAEAASTRLVQTMADVADVLTADQRQEILERFQHWHH